MTEFADRIERGVLSKGLLMKDLAEIIGISGQYLSQIKSGSRRPLAMVRRIAQVLECDPSWLLTGSGDAPGWADDDYFIHDSGGKLTPKNPSPLPPGIQAVVNKARESRESYRGGINAGDLAAIADSVTEAVLRGLAGGDHDLRETVRRQAERIADLEQRLARIRAEAD